MCRYIHIHTCIYMQTQIHICTHMHTQVHPHMHAYTHTVHIYMYACTHAYMHIHRHTHLRVHTHIYECTYACVYTHTYAYTYAHTFLSTILIRDRSFLGRAILLPGPLRSPLSQVTAQPGGLLSPQASSSPRNCRGKGSFCRQPLLGLQLC